MHIQTSVFMQPNGELFFSKRAVYLCLLILDELYCEQHYFQQVQVQFKTIIFYF